MGFKGLMKKQHGRERAFQLRLAAVGTARRGRAEQGFFQPIGGVKVHASPVNQQHKGAEGHHHHGKDQNTFDQALAFIVEHGRCSFPKD